MGTTPSSRRSPTSPSPPRRLSSLWLPARSTTPKRYRKTPGSQATLRYLSWRVLDYPIIWSGEKVAFGNVYLQASSILLVLLIAVAAEEISRIQGSPEADGSPCTMLAIENI